MLRKCKNAENDLRKFILIKYVRLVAMWYLIVRIDTKYGIQIISKFKHLWYKSLTLENQL